MYKEAKLKKERTVHPVALIMPMSEEEPVSHISVIVKCPDCGNVHVHGWGTGWRQPDCGSEKGSYYLVCDDDKFSADIRIRKPINGDALLRLLDGK